MTEAVEERTDIVTVDHANFDKYGDEKLGVTPAQTPEEFAVEELARVEAEKAERLAAEKAEEDPTHDLGETVSKKKRDSLNERFREMTEKRKDAEAKATAEAQRATEAAERADALQRERDELKAKYEPPKDLSAEPLPEQFADVKEFVKARDEWIADKTRREDAQKAEQDRQEKERVATAKAWEKRQDEAKAKIPDYDKIISESKVVVSDQVRGAILESDVGPELLVHLAQNPDFAAELGKMTVAKALVSLGKLEATLGGTAKPATKSTPISKVVEISKAREPISPLKNADAPVMTLRGTDEVPKGLSYDDWKAMYQAGKIK